jgi:hypothetical protein
MIHTLEGPNVEGTFPTARCRHRRNLSLLLDFLGGMTRPQLAAKYGISYERVRQYTSKPNYFWIDYDRGQGRYDTGRHPGEKPHYAAILRFWLWEQMRRRGRWPDRHLEA